MHPTSTEIQAIYQLWKEAFAFDDGGFTDDFFKRNFTIETCYVLRENDRIVATLCAFEHTMYLQGKHLPILFISGVITKQEERHKGYMRKLFQLVYQVHKDTALILLQAYHPEVYASLDFHMLYYDKTYELHKRCEESTNVTYSIHAKDMEQVSDQFLNAFDGYLLRDIAYYENYIKEVAAQNLLLYGIYTKHTLQGFACLDKQNGVVEELMYVDDKTRQSLLSHAQSLCDIIHVHSYTPLPGEVLTTHGTLMVHLHNPSVVKNILQREIHTLTDVFKYSHKPLYHYGSW